MSARVTVCIPTIGRMDYLPRTIESARNQTMRDIEVLVLDNASPAIAQTALAKWAAEDSRVRILRADPRVPMFVNFNRGLQAATTPYVAWFHDDDVYSSRFIEGLFERLEKSPHAGFAGTANYDFINEQGKVVEQRRWIASDRTTTGREYIEEVLTRGRNVVPLPGNLFRRSALGKGFDETLSLHYGDFVVLMRIAEDHDVCLVAEPLINVRRHEAQASRAMPISQAIPLRTRTLLDYCKEYRGKYPHETAFTKMLERRIKVRHRLALGWGWLFAPDGDEAAACAAALDSPRLRGALRGLDTIGVRRVMATERVKGIARRIAPIVRV